MFEFATSPVVTQRATRQALVRHVRYIRILASGIDDATPSRALDQEIAAAAGDKERAAGGAFARRRTRRHRSYASRFRFLFRLGCRSVVCCSTSMLTSPTGTPTTTSPIVTDRNPMLLSSSTAIPPSISSSSSSAAAVRASSTPMRTPHVVVVATSAQSTTSSPAPTLARAVSLSASSNVELPPNQQVKKPLADRIVVVVNDVRSFRVVDIAAAAGAVERRRNVAGGCTRRRRSHRHQPRNATDADLVFRSVL
jgi:hypothetical protein